MPKISTLMNIGKRSMMNSKSALQTVSHNIANKNTEGYSRQRVEMETTPPVGWGNTRTGTGARVKTVTRINNPHIEKQLQHEGEKLGFNNGQTGYLNRVEQLFNESNGKGINHFASQFFNSFRELANNPESLPIRAVVKESAIHLTKNFKRMSDSLKTIKSDIDNQLAIEVEEINRMTQEIASLNEKVQSAELLVTSANDERDARDLLVKKLSEKMNIKVSEGSRGAISITAGNTAVLVSGSDAATLKISSSPEKGIKREGNFDIVYQASKFEHPVTITSQLKGGLIGGLLEVRDNAINQKIDAIDSAAYTIGKKVNEAHVKGYDQGGRKAGFFFQDLKGPENAAEMIQVHHRIENDPSFIASGVTPHAPGDNRVANYIAGLQNQGLFNGGRDTIDEYYNAMVGDIAVMTNKANSTLEHQQEIVNQLKNLRESISGVSLDEETMNMIEYQKAFDASARLIRAADEMLEEVINLKR